jgi:hypothetical protein
MAWNGRAKRFYGVFDPSLSVYDCMAAASNFKDVDGKLVPENKGRVVGGSSVGHVATYVAAQLMCNPISLVGLDLSYPGGEAYVSGASNQKDTRKQKLVQLDDLSGNKVGTNVSMQSYKMVFEQALPRIIIETGIKFYNCTEDAKGRPAGILEVGAEPRSIDKVIDEHCNKDNKEVFDKWLRTDEVKANF